MQEVQFYLPIRLKGIIFTLKCQGDGLLQFFQLFCESQFPLLQWERTLARHNVLPEVKVIGSERQQSSNCSLRIPYVNYPYVLYSVSEDGINTRLVIIPYLGIGTDTE